MVDRFFDVPDRTADYVKLLEPRSYLLAYRDGLNAFFVAEEHKDLARHFFFPPGIADRLTHAASVRPFEEKIAKLRSELASLRAGRRGSSERAKGRKKLVK
jgi:hypothetical protein